MIRNQLQTVGVVMRCHNSGNIIGQTLQGLFSQTLKQFHLLIVDSGSTDNTLAIAEKYPAKILTIPAQDYYPGKVLNMAMEQMRSDLVIFLNSDAMPLSPYTLESLIAPFSEPAVQATYARQLPRPDAYTWVKRDYEAAFPADHAAPWMIFSLSLAAIRHSIWQQRPFYTAAWGSEDVEWANWAKAQGYVIRYVPESLCMHSHNYTCRQLYGRRFIEGEADAYIHHKRYSLAQQLFDSVKAMVRDIGYYGRAGDWSGLPYIPAIRWIYYWGYYRGHRWGTKRQALGSDNTQRGQQEVLKHYDS